MREQSKRSFYDKSDGAESVLASRETALREIDGISGLLVQTRTAIGELREVLSGLLGDGAGREGGEDPVGLIGTRLSDLLSGLKLISGELGAEQVGTACNSIRALTRDIVRSGLEFQMVAKLTAITVASLRSRNSELETYANSFSEVTGSLAEVSHDVEAQVTKIILVRGRALADFTSAATELTRAFDQIQAELRRGQASGRRDLELEIGAAAVALSSCTRDEMSKLVGAIQFVDAFAQRSEHIAEALSRAKAAAPPRARMLRHVALALSDDLVEGMRRMLRDLKASIRRIGAEGASANRVFEAKLISGDIESALKDRERSLALAVKQVTMVGTRMDTIETRTREMEGLAAEARVSLGNLVNISGHIMVSSVNAGLMASRISSSGGPLSVLAAAAQQQALACSKRIEACRTGVSGLIETMDGLALDKVRGELDGVVQTGRLLEQQARDTCGVSASLGTVPGRIEKILDTIDRIDAEAAALISAVETALAAFEAGLAPVRAGEAGKGPVGGDASMIDDLRAIYTMQNERDIHDRALGVGPRAAEAGSALQDASADLDDILF